MKEGFRSRFGSRLVRPRTDKLRVEFVASSTEVVLASLAPRVTVFSNSYVVHMNLNRTSCHTHVNYMF